MDTSRKDLAWKAPELAHTYLDGVRGAVPLADVQIDVMLRYIRAAGRPIRRFLDLGCGDGILGAAILRAYPMAAGVFGDVSDAMLSAAIDRLGERGAMSRFLLLDYGTPAWLALVKAHAPFDAIVSGFSIHHQPDTRKRTLYCEIFELLAPGGTFVNIEHVASATTFGEGLFEEHFIDALYDLEQTRGGEKTRDEVARTYYHRRDKGANILAPVEAQVEWLREIGFDDADCYYKLFELAVFAGRRPT